jgi:TonB-dependent receptor
MQAAAVNGRRTTAHPLTLKSTVLALAGAGLFTCTPLWAQDATTANGDQASERSVVVVTGVRRAAQSAQKIKQDADNIVDSIVADDIGKFPDTNVAETIARVTGIQVSRDGGEARNVLIRGLPGIATLLNGREMFTTTGRYIQLADIPSTMLQGVQVYKSQSADQMEGGIAGIIDVRLNRPFDFSGQKIAANVTMRNKDKGKKTDPEASAMYSNRWKTDAGEFGALIGVSYVDDHYWEERSFNTFPIQKDWLLPKLTGPDLVGIEAIFGHRKRSGVNFSLQYKPNRDVELYAEGIATHYDARFETDFFVGLPWWADGAGIKATKISGTDQLDTLTSKNANTILSTQANAADNKTSQYAIGGKWNVNANLRASAEIAQTNSRYDWRNPILDTLMVVPNVYVKTNVNGSAFMQYGGIDMADSKNAVLWGLFDRYGNDKGSSTDFHADTTYTPDSEGLFKSFSVGVRANNRSAESIKSFEGSVGAPANVKASTIPGLNCTSPSTSVNYGTQNWYTPCANYLLDNTGVVRQAVTGTSAARGIDPGSFFKETEKNFAIYLKAKFGFDLGSIPVDGDVGTRVSKTKSDLVGKSIVNGKYVDTPVSTNNTEVLPSANLTAHLRQDVLARVAASKTLTRPDFAQLNPGTAYINSNGSTVLATASGGNPNLTPVIGKNIDAALEWYFAPGSMASATIFRHDFDGYILNRVAQETYQGVKYDATRPFNTGKGHLQGMEFAYRQFFDMLPGAFSGLGVEANYTYMEGGITESGGSSVPTVTFPGLSKNAYNLVALYEKYGVSARLAYNWRSKFVQTYGDRPSNAGTSPARDLITAPISTLDGSISYTVTPEVSVTLKGTNLLNFKYVDYWDNKDLFPRDTRRYDRTVGLSLSWKH